MKENEEEDPAPATAPPEKKTKTEKVAFYKMFAFGDSLDALLMAVGLIGGIGSGITQPVMTIVFGDLINAFGRSSQSDLLVEVKKAALKMVYLGIAAAVSAFLQVSCWMVTGERQSARIRGLYLKAILRQDIGYFDTETNTGEIIGRMSGDTVLIQDAMGEKVGKFTQQMSQFISAFIVAFTKGWLLTLVLLSTLPVIAGVAAFVMRSVSRTTSRGQVAYSDAGNVVEQTIGAIRTVVSFTGEKLAIQKYNSKLKEAYRATLFQSVVSGIGFGTMTFVIFSSYGLAVWVGAKLIINRGYNGGQIINVIFSVLTGAVVLGQTSPQLNAFAAGQAAAYKMFETIERVPRIDPYDERGDELEYLKGDIELRDVHFRYPARPDVQIFQGFSLEVPNGTTVALVGQSGSGKSTIISLIERFYDPDSGDVFIDGVNLKQLKLRWIRKQIGLVSQEPILFATTIRENISYGKENATDEEIRTAIELANAAKFIDTMPQGLDTMVGEHGTQLSGGQKQRIAISRAILKNPKILLLDEATSALDSESERVVQDALERAMSNRTTVVVAHRLTTIRNADAIAVVHRGKIVEKGSHDELIKDPEGGYSQLIRLQEGSKKAEQHESRLSGESSSIQEKDRPSFSRTSSRSGSERPSIRKSFSRDSTDSRPSFSLSGIALGIPPRPIEIEENEAVEDEEATKKKKPKNVSLKRLAALNKPEIGVLLAGSVAAAVHGVAFPIFGLLLSNAIKMFFEPPHQLRKDSRFWALMYVAIGVVVFVALPAQYFFFGIAGGKLIERIRSLTFERAVHQEISWFDDPANSSGAVGSRLSTDASAIRSLVGDALGLLAQNTSTILAALVISFTSNWRLALVVIAVSPLMVAPTIAQARFLKGFSKDAKTMYEEASQVANDAVGGMRTVASFCAENKVLDLYHLKCKNPIDNAARAGLTCGFGYGFSFLVLNCVNALIFFLGAVFVKQGKATFQDVFRVFFALTIAAVGISNSSGVAPDSRKAKDSAASIFSILDRKSRIDSSVDEGITLENVTGDIQLQNVSFRYPMRPNVQVFRDLSLAIPSGKTVALVGESGSGKSTVISLIERFYDPESGTVFLDKVDLKKLKLTWLRQQMGLVGQEPILFNDTIRSNIAYGKHGGNATEEEIVAAACAANANSFISSLPHGYDTNVGERGTQLSGGQKQRIAIARAVLKNPRILLLDEATSALDAESERIVQDALDNVMVSRTTVVVAHRLATIKNADVIAVVKNGVIVEKGKHEDLMKMNGGAYASLVALHMSAE
ncbi:ABC transporter B family member 9 [Linum perenne]